MVNYKLFNVLLAIALVFAYFWVHEQGYQEGSIQGHKSAMDAVNAKKLEKHKMYGYVKPIN